MFKKGSFEIGGTIYPVAIKVWGRSWLLNLRMTWGSVFVRVVGSCCSGAANESTVALVMGHLPWLNPGMYVTETVLTCDWKHPLRFKTGCGGLWREEGISSSFDSLQYDPQFGDAFWNSSKYNIVSYLLRIMTSWAIVCNVWYMPPMVRKVIEHLVDWWLFKFLAFFKCHRVLALFSKPLATLMSPIHFYMGLLWVLFWCMIRLNFSWCIVVLGGSSLERVWSAAWYCQHRNKDAKNNSKYAAVRGC